MLLDGADFESAEAMIRVNFQPKVANLFSVRKNSFRRHSLRCFVFVRYYRRLPSHSESDGPPFHLPDHNAMRNTICRVS